MLTCMFSFISNANGYWVFDISNKYFLGYFDFSILVFVLILNFTNQLIHSKSYCRSEHNMFVAQNLLSLSQVSTWMSFI